MIPVVLDTDTVSLFFRKNMGVVKNIETHLLHHGYIYLSVITVYEVLNGLYWRDNKRNLNSFKAFVAANRVLSIEQETVEIAARNFADLRKRGITIGHNDVMIAACALQHNLELVTRNTKHFQHISHLQHSNWAE
ncbi:MAG: type II toxin-antitoxin system VapC family toxin [Bacteroidota bacterium]